MSENMNDKQPPPIRTDRKPTWELVINDLDDLPRHVRDLLREDMKARDKLGREKHGVALTAGNGRNHLIDAYQEALDLVAYLRNEVVERRDMYGPIGDRYYEALMLAYKIRKLIGQ